MSTDDTIDLPANSDTQDTCDAHNSGHCSAQHTEQAQAPGNEGDSSTPYGYSAHPYGATAPNAPYGAPAWQYAQNPYFTNPLIETLRTNSVFCLILGILGLVVFGIFTSIPAWVWGNSILAKAKAHGIDESVVVNAKVGKILGIIGTALSSVVIILVLLFAMFFIFALTAGMATHPMYY